MVIECADHSCNERGLSRKDLIKTIDKYERANLWKGDMYGHRITFVSNYKHLVGLTLLISVKVCQTLCQSQ